MSKSRPEAEAYEFTWPGKKRAKEEALREPAGKLIPDRGGSINWDHTKNLYIEGDNLEALKLLRRDYENQVDLIYIDPPYNTGNDFIYMDNFTIGAARFQEQSGSGNAAGKAESSGGGRFHADWCSMIYARLLAARDLLTDDGAIFISIDDNELFNLKKICDEVFGEANFITMFTWVKTMNPPSLGSKARDNIEYILCYEKRFSSAVKLYGRESNQKDSPLANAPNREITVTIPALSCDFTDMESGVIHAGLKPSGVQLLDEVHVVEGVNKKPFRVSFHSKWAQENIDREVEQGTRFLIKKSSYFSLRYIKGNINYVVPDKLLDYHKFNVRDNEFGRKELEELLGKVGFDYPKNTPLIQTLIRMYMKNKKSGIVMDFFSGSATTAHAVMKQNAQDGGTRSYIMVQYPEECPPQSPARRAGYETICDIGRARIVRAAEKIWNDTGADFDTGFKLYRIGTEQQF